MIIDQTQNITKCIPKKPEISNNFFEITDQGCAYFAKVEDCIVNTINNETATLVLHETMQLLFQKSPCAGRDGRPFLTPTLVLVMIVAGVLFLIILMACANKKCRNICFKCCSKCK